MNINCVDIQKEMSIELQTSKLGKIKNFKNGL